MRNFLVCVDFASQIMWKLLSFASVYDFLRSQTLMFLVYLPSCTLILYVFTIYSSEVPSEVYQNFDGTSEGEKWWEVIHFSLPSIHILNSEMRYEFEVISFLVCSGQ